MTGKNDIFAALSLAGHAPAVAQCLTLKLVNICLARVEFAARRTRVVARPFGIEIDPCNGCALACPGCVHSMRSRQESLFDWPNGLIDPNRFASWLSQFAPYAVHVMFGNYGEPLLNSRTPAYIRAAKSFLAQTMLSTSLSLPRFDPDALVTSGLDYLVLSIDGATQPTYSRFRRNGNLELVLDNLRRLVAARRAHGRRLPYLAWQYLAFEHNRHEIPRALELAREIGVDEFRISRPFAVDWDDPTIQVASSIPPETIPLQPISPTDFAANWNPFPGEIAAETIHRAYRDPWRVPGTGPLEPATAGHTCHWLYMSTVMDATGRVLPCCCAPKPDCDVVFAQYDGTDVFNSPKHQLARRHFATGHRSPTGPHCQDCEWNQLQPDIAPSYIREYGQAIRPSPIDAATASWLATWPSPAPDPS